MKTRSLFALCLAMLLPAFTFAADLVAKFDSLSAGAKSGAFIIGENGRTITSSASWLVSDGVTVVVEYSGFTKTSEDVAFASLKQSNKDQKNLVGIGAKNGKFYGVYNGSIWSSVTTGSDVPASGTLVFSYNNNGVVAYTVTNGEKMQVYAAGALKETKDGFKLGTSFDIGALNAGTLSAGITVSKVLIYNGATAADDVVSVATSTSNDITLPNGTYTVSQVLSGSGAVTVDAGTNGEISLSAANTFTGGLTVKSGTAKQTITDANSHRGFGPNNVANNKTDNLARISIESGATLDYANTQDACYSITSAGTITNSGSAIGPTSRQITFLTLNGDTTASGNQFGIVGPGYAATTLNLGEHTLTVNMASATTTFILCNSTVSGTGKIRLEQGKLYLKKAITGTLNLDLPAVPEDGATLFSLDNDRDITKMTINVTVDGEALPENVTISKEGVVTVTSESGAVVEKNGAVWRIDTTDGIYVFSAEEISYLKSNYTIVYLNSSSDKGATIDFGDMTGLQQAHFIFESGRHALKWKGNSASMNFGNAVDITNPCISVKNGAILDFYAKDVTGWQSSASNAAKNIFRVFGGGKVFLHKNGDNTFFFAGLWYLEPGAEIEADDFQDNKVCLSGGIDESHPQIHVISPTGENKSVTYRSNVGFRFPKDNPKGYGIQVDENSTLILEGDVSSVANDCHLGKFGEGTLEITGSLSGFSGEIKLAAGSVKVKSTSGLAAEKVVQFEEDDEKEIKVATEGEWYVYTNEPKIVFNPETDTVATTPVLRFSEIMPKPSDKPYSITTQAGYDKNGLESGWVELENTSDKWVDLKDYKFCRANRGKVYTHADYGNFPSVMIPPHGRFTFYTSERYSNSYPEAKDGNTSAFQHGTFDGKPIWYGDMLIWGDKVNPKKFPYVTLAYRPTEATADQILETVIIPSDTPEGYSIIVGHDEADDEATARWLCPSPTKNAANTDTTNLVKIGPNVGSVYGTAKSVSEFAATTPATPGQPYTVSLNVNPVYNAAETREADKITAVTLVYRTKLGKGASGRVPMTMSGKNDGGDIWTAEIPAEDIPTEPGQLIQWKTEITDAANNTWTSPSFMNKDDGYEWFGTITDPGDLNSAKLPTWHMFVDDASKAQMDKDADDQTLENNARVAIYDASTSTYYDYVRIDLRGNTSAHFNKKSHGLRFSKANPLTMYDPVRKITWSGVRKSSLIGEPADPSFMRQMIGFWLWNKMGNLTPFDFPVRCNLNGEFYQLAFHSERFTDELIEDVYKLDKYGYGYKNVGTLIKTTAGGAEKKTPDDGNESDLSMLNTNLVAYISAANNINEDNADLTKTVVERFDLPAWLNYLASARITQEMDDVWANISIYRDSAQMLEGVRGKGTWMPLGYDFNVSFGQYYHDGSTNVSPDLMANQDWFKSHPFYGGMMVRCHDSSFSGGTVNNGNLAMESVWQSSKFRRLYLRRLRTLMDQELKEPGTPETEVPFMVKMRELAELMYADSELDHQKYGPEKNGWNSSFSAIDSWGQSNWPKDIKAGVDDIWNNYVVPRRKHLYVTHAASSIGKVDEDGEPLTDLKAIGYGSQLSAGIPAAQSSLDDLKEGLSAETVEGGIVIRNTNAEAIDLSGWDVSGPAVMKLPAGTVIDQAIDGTPGEVFVVTDRRAYVAANLDTLTDEVIIGNAKAGSGTDIGLTAADGTIVLSADVILAPGTYTGVSYDVPVTLSPAGSFTFAGATFNGGLNLVEGDYKLKNDGSTTTNTASVVNGPAANITFTGKGTFELKGEKTSGTLMTVNNLIVSNGVFTVESKATSSETSAIYLNGGFAVEDKGTVNLKLTKNAAQGRGFFIANKKMFCRIGKGGSFNAELNGPGCQAIHGEKGSVDLEIQDSSAVTATGTGANARYFKMAGNIVISGGTVNADASGKGAEIFSADKDITISGGTLNLTADDDCVNAATGITISGGAINGTSTNGDVFDSNGTMSITGGSIVGLAIGTESDGKSGQVFDVNEPNVVDFTDSTATIFAISGIDATLGAETTAADISGKTIKEWTAPEITGVETVKLFMMIDGQEVTLEAEGPASWEEVVVTEDTTVAELVGAEQGAKLVVLKVEPAKIVDWAKTYAADSKPGEAINLEAFALNCAPEEVETKKEDFKVTITFGEDGTPVVETVEGVTLNITPVIKGKVDLTDSEWIKECKGAKFFKAFIDIEQN